MQHDTHRTRNSPMLHSQGFFFPRDTVVLSEILMRNIQDYDDDFGPALLADYKEVCRTCMGHLGGGGMVMYGRWALLDGMKLSHRCSLTSPYSCRMHESGGTHLV